MPSKPVEESQQPIPQNSTEPPTSGIDKAAPGLPYGLMAETVEQAPVAISITDAHANILYVNQAFTKTTGYAPEESIGRNESMLSDQQTPKHIYESLWRNLQEQLSWQGCLVNRHKNGQRYLADLIIAPILDEHGKTSHFIGMHRNVTEVFSLERQVLNQKRLIETVVDLSPVATVLLDESSRVLLDNQMYKALSADLRNSEPASLFLDVLQKSLGAEWLRMKRKGLSFRNQEVRIDRGGHFSPKWYSCSGSWFTRGEEDIDAFFKENAQTYLLLTFNEITQQKKHEEEIRINALRALMAEEEKIQSMKETLSGAIHHIQGPVNLLDAARNMIMRRGTEQLNSSLLTILDQVVVGGKKTIDQLQACIPDTNLTAPSLINLNQLLHETIILLTERLLSNGIVVVWKPTMILPSITGMENRLRAMLKQIFENAIDAMKHSSIERRELRISTRVDGNLIHITIEDTGPGIPEDLLIKVFEPFFTTKNQGSNRHPGMGLSMAQEIVSQHQGIIRFDSTYREGCRVQIQFNTHTQNLPSEHRHAHA